MPILKNYLLASTVLLSIASISPAQAETYTIDPMHTYVLWHINHFGFSNPSGKWLADGTIELDKTDLQNSKANVTINLADMITGIPELDKHLKGSQFFDVEHFPKATFVSDKVEVVDNKIAKLHGLLTVHGISKPVVLDVQLNKMGKNPITDRDTIGFSGQTEVKRSDFGMKTLIPGLSDEVKLNIEVEAYIPKAAQPPK